MPTLQPILKWAGGKEQELKYILPLLPPTFSNYYEPFVGGGAVYTAVQAKHYYINDKSDELISLYENLSETNNVLFCQAIDEIIHNWDLLTLVVQKNEKFFIDIYAKFSNDSINELKFKNLLFEFILHNAEQFNGMFSNIFNFNIENFIKEIKINMLRKTKRMKQLEQVKGKLPNKDILENIETSLKSAFYMHFRHIYNFQNRYNLPREFKSAIFLFIRNFSYSGMFRYNSKGEFNVPYGGIGYNRKNFSKKRDYLVSDDLKKHLHLTTISCLDFEEFLSVNNPSAGDFIFIDPPYDSEFSTYANNTFTRDDQTRLATVMLKCNAKWMLIIKKTDFISSLYSDKGLNIRSFDKTYLVSFMNRNNKEAEHLLITNY